jgi:hypothetical protein
MQHITKCARKPWNLACEFKDSICAMSQVMLAVEICEGKDAQHAPTEFVDESTGFKKGTAMVGRLTKNWHGTGRTVVADSYFASVFTAVFLLNTCGLYFTGLVKTASKFYPKQWCNTVEMTARGQTRTAVAIKQGVQMMAHTWNDPGKVGKPRKNLISTCCSTGAAPEASRPRKRQRDDGAWEDWFRLVPRTNVVKHYFDWAGAIDRHNRQRMDGLRIEHTLEFHRWWLRVFTSFLGVIVVDTVNAWNLEQEAMSDHDAYEQLAFQLINNRLRGAPESVETGIIGRGVSREEWQGTFSRELFGDRMVLRPIAEEDREESKLLHEVVPLRSLPKYAAMKNAKLNCRVCKEQTATVYCKTCGINEHSQLLALCLPGTGKQCLSLHCQT